METQGLGTARTSKRWEGTITRRAKTIDTGETKTRGLDTARASKMDEGVRKRRAWQLPGLNTMSRERG